MELPASAAVSPRPSSSPRLVVEPRTERGRESWIGTWSPQSSSLAVELPALVDQLASRGVRVSRVSYNPELWDEAPRKIAVGGRVVKLGWFRTMDQHALRLTGGGNECVDLTAVVPRSTQAVS